MTDSCSKKELDHESSLHCCVTMKLVYKQVFSPLQFCFLLSLPNNLFTCLPSCTCFLFRFSVLFYISPLVLVAILLYIYSKTFIPALVLPKRATLHLDVFVTLCCVNYRFRNTYILRHHVYTIKHACTCYFSTTSSSCTRTPTIYRRRRKVDQTS